MGNDKLHLPGWRIEQKFNNKVLIGNWNEERRQFQCGSKPFGNSTNRHDFKQYGNYVPDIKTRREAQMRNDGLSKKFIFSHHGFGYSNNLISLYDQLMNNRDVKESTLPTLRTWDNKTMSWLPERTDHPLQGRPTSFGLHEKLHRKWRQEQDGELNKHLRSTYTSSFEAHPKSAMTFRHYATQRALSSHFHTPNFVNKNLSLRNTNANIAPEFQPSASNKTESLTSSI